MSKFSILKENMHRFKTKNLAEQAEQQDAKVSPAVQKFLDQNISADFVFMRGVKENDPLEDIAIGTTEMRSELATFWERTLEQYRKTKDQGAFNDLMKTIKNPGVTIRPYNGGEESPYKYEAVGTKTLRLVKV